MTTIKHLSIKDRVTALFLGKVEQKNTIETGSERNRMTFANSSEEMLELSRLNPGESHISYDPALIDNLKKDHQNLLALFSEITKNLLTHDFKNATYGLEDFQSLLRDHVHEENLKLYCGIDSMVKNISNIDSVDNSDSKDMKAEMSRIKRKVTKIISIYLNVGLRKSNVDDFLKQWTGLPGETEEAIQTQRESVKSILVKRIDTEEKRLYRIYETLGQDQIRARKRGAKNV